MGLGALKRVNSACLFYGELLGKPKRSFEYCGGLIVLRANILCNVYVNGERSF